MEYENEKLPTAKEILSRLVELYADQMGVKIKYTIIDKTDEEKRHAEA